jgi:CDP-paratose 2-epimerase
LRGDTPEARFDTWRPGDQPWYVSNISTISAALGWRPQIGLRDGLRTLEQWLEGRFGVSEVAAQREQVRV